MSTINSHTLFHITRNFSVFKKIITNGLRYSYSLEKTDTETAIIQGLQYIPDFSDEKLQENILNGNPQTNVAIPMICFCDIPLLRIEDHCNKYGKFAIGLNKEIISEAYNNQINPVWYLESKNTYDFVKNYTLINYSKMRYIYEITGNTTLIEDMVKNEDVKKKYFKNIKENVETKILSNYILGYTKDRKINNTSFYDEREWRALLPDDEDIAGWIWDIDKGYFDSHKKEWNNSLGENKEYGHMILISEMLNDAITHIIVDKDKKIPEVINYIMKTKKVFGVSNVSFEQRLLLISKITSFERINNDY